MSKASEHRGKVKSVLFFKSILVVVTSKPHWLACFTAVFMAGAAMFPAWIQRPSQNLDLDMGDDEVVVSLERTAFRYDFVVPEKSGECPGSSCLLNPSSSAQQLKLHRAPISNFLSLITEKGLNKLMYIRWDLTTPNIVRNVGDLVAFDFYGMVGDQYRFFVNGVEIQSGIISQQMQPIVFSSPSLPGEVLTLGFEIDVGSHLTPGLVNIAQPFLSRPSLAPKLRNYYRAKDKVALLPLAVSNTLIAILAAVGAVFTPFFLELIVFSLFVTGLNVRRLLLNGLVDYNTFFGVDAIVMDSVARAAIFATLWAFWRLYFRSQSKLALVPVLAYIGLLPFFVGSVFIQEFAFIVIVFAKYTDIHFAAAFMAGAFMAISSRRKSARNSWAIFRRRVCLLFAVANFILCATFLSRFFILFGELDQQTLLQFSGFLEFARQSLPAFTTLSGLAIFLEWAIIVRDRQTVLQKFGRVVDPRLINEIIRGPEQSSKRLEKVTVMVVDLRGFTELCERFEPDFVTKSLNQYLSLVTRVVRRHGGVVDKFVGDSVVAYWGAPSPGDKDEISAVRAAVEVRASLELLNEERRLERAHGLSIGIGLHCGTAIFGPVGATDRVDYTVIGEAINIASRVQTLTKSFDFDILLTERLYNMVAEQTLVEDVGHVKVKGVEQLICLHRLIGVEMTGSDFLVGKKSIERDYLGRSPGRLQKAENTILNSSLSDQPNANSQADELAA